MRFLNTIFAVACFAFITAGCGGGGGAGGGAVAPPDAGYEGFFYFEGAVPQAREAASAQDGPPLKAADFVSGKYSIVATDRYLNKELVAAAVTGDRFSLSFSPAEADSFIMLTVKENATGRFFYRNLIGRIPKYSQLPAGLKGVKILNIELNDFSTALALYSAEKDIVPPAFIDFAGYAGETVISRNYGEIKSISQNMITNGAGGLSNVIELAKAAKTLFYILSSDTLVSSVKNEIMPPPRNFTTAGEALRYFVRAVDSGPARAEIRAMGLYESVTIAGAEIGSGATPELIDGAVGSIRPLEKVAAPVISPSGGKYAQTIEVSISCATAGARIHYTLDGRTPNSSSPVYQGPILLTTTAKLTAVAMKNDMIESELASAFYTIEIAEPAARAAAPVFTPPPGVFAPGVEISIASATPGASIYYTLDGSLPTPGKALLYSDTVPVKLASTAVLNALATKAGFLDSIVASGTYEIVDSPVKVATPVFGLTPGVYNSSREVEINCATAGATIYYTLDGTEPNVHSIKYAKPITVLKTVTIKAFAVKNGYIDSDAVTASYEIAETKLETEAPVFNFESGIYDRTLEVVISCPTPGATIYYTLDHGVPTFDSPKFTSTIEVSMTTTIKAFAVAPGRANSSVATAEYTVFIHGQDNIAKPSGLFYYSVNKIVRWNPVIVKDRQIEYAVRVDGNLMPQYASKPEFSVAFFLTGWRTIQVQAKIAGSSHPLDFGPMSDVLRFNIKASSNLPQITDIALTSGYFNWRPHGEANDVYGYRVMFDDDINNIFVSRSACYGVPPGMESGPHRMRVQAVVIEATDLQITVLDEGPWSAEYQFDLSGENRPYELIPVPENFGYEPLAGELKWSLSQPVSSYIYHIYACYDRPSGNAYAKLMQVVATDSVALAAVKEKLPPDSFNCLLEVVAFDGFDRGLKSPPIWLPVGDLPEIPKVTGLKYEPASKLIRWDGVYVDEQPCVYRIKIDGQTRHNVLSRNEYNAAALMSGTHEVQVQALLQNYNPELTGPYSETLEIFIDTNVPQVTGLAFVNSRKIVRWLPVVVSEQICYYRVMLDGVERSELFVKPEYSTATLSPGTHEIAVRAVIANLTPEVAGPYSEVCVFNTMAVKESDELAKITQIQFDSYNNIVRWQPVLVEKLPTASYVVELDGVIMTHAENRQYTRSASYGISESVPAGTHTIRIKPIIADKSPPVEGSFSEPFFFYVQRTDALYKKIKEPAAVWFDEENQTLFWDKASTTLGIPTYNVIGYFNTGVNVTEQSFPLQETRLNLGVLKFDTRFTSMPSGKYSIEIQGAVVENSKAKSLKTPALILELTDERKWLNIK